MALLVPAHYHRRRQRSRLECRRPPSRRHWPGVGLVARGVTRAGPPL